MGGFFIENDAACFDFACGESDRSPGCIGQGRAGCTGRIVVEASARVWEWSSSPHPAALPSTQRPITIRSMKRNVANPRQKPMRRIVAVTALAGVRRFALSRRTSETSTPISRAAGEIARSYHGLGAIGLGANARIGVLHVSRRRSDRQCTGPRRPLCGANSIGTRRRLATRAARQYSTGRRTLGFHLRLQPSFAAHPCAQHAVGSPSVSTSESCSRASDGAWRSHVAGARQCVSGPPARPATFAQSCGRRRSAHGTRPEWGPRIPSDVQLGSRSWDVLVGANAALRQNDWTTQLLILATLPMSSADSELATPTLRSRGMLQWAPHDRFWCRTGLEHDLELGDETTHRLRLGVGVGVRVLDELLAQLDIWAPLFDSNKEHQQGWAAQLIAVFDV